MSVTYSRKRGWGLRTQRILDRRSRPASGLIISASGRFFPQYMQDVEYTRHMNEERFSQQARLFRTLMHPTRIAILEELRAGEQCVCHLEAFLGYRQAYISQQLAVLRKAGLIADRRDGLNVFYRIAQPGVLALLDTACALVGGIPPPLQRRALEVSCDCPKCAGDARLVADVTLHLADTR